MGFFVCKGFQFSVFGFWLRYMEPKVIKSRSFKDLEVWKLSINLVREVYQVTSRFPGYENFGLTNQVKRAAVSIPSNIAEGQGRNSAKEFGQFLAIALGSVAELETQLIIAKEIKYLALEELNPLLSDLDRIRKMIKSLADKIAQPSVLKGKGHFPKTENRKPET